jgi:PTH1 family peptidyl-tRNA hydrolase
MSDNRNILIAGLGNIGAQYELTRHNVGFLFVDALAEQFEIELANNKFHAILGARSINGIKVILAKPQTFMNRSGVAVSEIANFYKIPKENILVVFDDLDMEFGKVRFRKGGGDAGHNGLKSIDSLLGKDYWKMKFGIGRPQHKGQVSDYVLSNFNSEEIKELDKIFSKFCQHDLFFLKQDYNTLLSKVSQQ